MPKWIITDNPNGATQDIILFLEGNKAAAAETLAAKSEELGAPLYIWELQGHTDLDIEITVVEDNGD